MLNHSENTAILVFTRTPVNEARTKLFQKNIGFKQNLELAKVFIRKTIAMVQSTNLPYFIVDERYQEGFTFKERLTNTAKSIFDKGYENIIIIGNDCPSLCSKTILKVKQHFSSHNLITAPATDGGVNLIGINQSIFDANSFQELPWKTKELSVALDNYTKEEVFNLPISVDIDNHKDFSCFLKSVKSIPFLVIQLEIILGRIYTFIHLDFVYHNLLNPFLSSPRRGPPIFL